MVHLQHSKDTKVVGLGTYNITSSYFQGHFARSAWDASADEVARRTVCILARRTS